MIKIYYKITSLDGSKFSYDLEKEDCFDTRKTFQAMHDLTEEMKAKSKLDAIDDVDVKMKFGSV